MGYIRDMYGYRNEDFFEGFKAAMEVYAVWRNGQRWIGSPEILLKDAIKEAKQELLFNDEEE